MEINLPKGLISPEKARELNQEFIKTRSNDLDKIVAKLDNNPKKMDALSAWFSLEEIKNYIAYVESKNPEVDGLRVYFGAYGKKETEKSNTSTVFFVPTKPASNNAKSTNIMDGGSSDIDDVDGLNRGQQGDPPNLAYPQV